MSDRLTESERLSDDRVREIAARDITLDPTRPSNADGLFEQHDEKTLLAREVLVHRSVFDTLEKERETLLGLLARARHNVRHSANHDHGFKSRELLTEIDAALSARRAAPKKGEE